MRGFLVVLMECSVTMSVLAFCFIALTPWLSKRYAAKWLYYCWLVIVIGLIIPFRLYPDTPLIHKYLFVSTVAVQQTAPDNSDITGQDQDQAGMQNIIIDTPGTVSGGQESTSGIIEQILHSPWYLWAGALWIFGAVIFTAFHGIRHRRFFQMMSRWSQKVSDQQTLDMLHDQKLGLCISKRVELRTCACITSPMMIGLVNPVILLTPEKYSEGELSLILRHELVHIKRKDLWYKVLVFIATAIHWFNPVIYLMAKAIAVQCEISCDMEVVKNTEMDKRQLYSETILSVAKNNRRMQTAFSTNFYGGKKEMKNRISFIMDVTKKKTGIFILCAAIILTISSGVVFAADADNTEKLKPLTEENGAILVYYHPFHTLEENVLKTLGKDVPGYPGEIGSGASLSPEMGPACGIDVNGWVTPTPLNRTEPYYGVDWGWMAKDNNEVKSYAQKALMIDGTAVTLAFTDETKAYMDDEVIEKMVNNVFSFASVYKDDMFDYDYKAFIDELANKGIIVIWEVIAPENFGWSWISTKDTGFWASKVLTEYDAKEKITSIYDSNIFVPAVNFTEGTDGNVGVQVGNSFTIKSGETLAIDIKELSDNMPKINWAIVDLDTGKTVDWMPNTLSVYRFVWTPSDKYVNNTFKIMVSTSEPRNVSDNAVLEIFTYRTGQQEMSSASD